MEPMDISSTIERRLIARASQAHAPINGSIELLPLCNMNCDMCYVRLTPEEMKAKGRLRSAEEWIEIGRQMAENGVLFLLLTGGEPLLFPDFKRVYRELKKMGLILTLNTNGTLLDEEWADFFAAHKPRRINITLYGADENAYESLCHYREGFTKTVQAIRFLRERKVDVKVGASVTPENKKDIDRMAELCRELDVPFFADTYMLPAVRERTRPFAEQSRLLPEEAARIHIRALHLELKEEQFRQYVKETLTEVSRAPKVNESLKKMSCLAGSCSFSINWQGELHPCVLLTSPSASVFEKGFQQSWEEMQQEIAKIRLSARCASCRNRCLCRTCAASALFETRQFDGTPEYMCRYTEESLRILKGYTE